MSKRIFSLASILLSLCSAAISIAQPTKPKLVVGIVVDQMRWDYLQRFAHRFSAEGFGRLLSQGFRCDQTFIPYLPSYTAPGHSCIYTGSVPAFTGMAGNDWYEQPSMRYRYCTADSTERTVGGPDSAGVFYDVGLVGQQSPRNLLASTMTDELRLATGMQSRVYGFALKDRGAVLPAGHLATGCYWMNDPTGNFVTSSYYERTLPEWLVTFNRRRRAQALIREPWTLAAPKHTYSGFVSDDNRFEGAMPGEPGTGFPHVAKTPAQIRSFPAGNTITLEAAAACLEANALGKGAQPDFLCISLSSTDYIGHQYGPESIEIEDCYIRLDRDLARFLQLLDRQVGKDKYLLFLTADHGAVHNADLMDSLRMPAGNLSQDTLWKRLNKQLAARYGKDSLIRSLENYQVTLNEPRVSAAGIDRPALKKQIRRLLLEQEAVQFAVDLEAASIPLPEPLAPMVRNGYCKGRSGCIQFVYRPGWYDGYRRTGTTHGTWSPDDTHIPLLWYGAGIRPGRSLRKVYMTDIAPTVCALLGIQAPNACVGSVIAEALR